MVSIISVISKKKISFISPWDFLLNYDPWWWPSWISNPHKNHTVCKTPQQVHSIQRNFQSSACFLNNRSLKLSQSNCIICTKITNLTSLRSIFPSCFWERHWRWCWRWQKQTDDNNYIILWTISVVSLQTDIFCAIGVKPV